MSFVAPVTAEETPSSKGGGLSAAHRAIVIPVAACLIALSFSMVFFHTKTGAVRNTNVGSRYATVEALVNWHTYEIDKTRYVNTIDKVKIGDHFYSSKSPLLPTVTAGVYWVWRAVTGDDIRTEEHNVVLLCNTVMVGLPHLLLLIFFLRFLLLFLRRPEAILVGVAGMSFAYIGMGYAIELNNHTPAAAAAFVAFYYAYRIRNDIDVKTRHWLFAGFSAGLLPGLDLPSLFIATTIGIYLLTYDPKKTLTLFVGAAVPPLLAHFIVTYIATDSIFPIYLRKELYQYEGSYWVKPRGIDALDEPKYIYGFHMILGHHGLFTITPPFVFSAIALYRMIRERQRGFLEAVALGGVSLFLVVFYMFTTNNYGGSCVGFRWLIVVNPFLWIFFAKWIDMVEMRKWMWALVVLSLMGAQFHVHDAIRSPWHDGKMHVFMKRIGMSR